MFTREQIVSFVAVFENGSFSAGARHLGRDRTTIREHIAILEDNIGVPMFKVEGRSAIPTTAAEKLFHRASSIVRQIEEFELAAKSSFNEELQTINICYDEMVPTSLFSDVNCKASEIFPTLQINWLHRSRGEAIEELIRGDVQLALMPIKMLVIPDKEVNYINLGRVSLSVYAGSNSRLAKKKQLRLSDLQLESQYIYENHMSSALQAIKVSPKNQLISTTDVLIELLQHSGWAILPNKIAQPYCKQGVLTKLNVYELVNSLDFGICVFFTPLLEQNDVVSTIMQLIRDFAKRELF